MKRSLKKRIAEIFPRAKVRVIVEHPTRNVVQMTLRGRKDLFNVEVSFPK